MVREIKIQLQSEKIINRQEKIEELKKINQYWAFLRILELEEEAAFDWEMALRQYSYLKNIN